MAASWASLPGVAEDALHEPPAIVLATLREASCDDEEGFVLSTPREFGGGLGRHRSAMGAAWPGGEAERLCDRVTEDGLLSKQDAQLLLRLPPSLAERYVHCLSNSAIRRRDAERRAAELSAVAKPSGGARGSLSGFGRLAAALLVLAAALAQSPDAAPALARLCNQHAPLALVEEGLEATTEPSAAVVRSWVEAVRRAEAEVEEQERLAVEDIHNYHQMIVAVDSWLAASPMYGRPSPVSGDVARGGGLLGDVDTCLNSTRGLYRSVASEVKATLLEGQARSSRHLDMQRVRRRGRLDMARGSTALKSTLC